MHLADAFIQSDLQCVQAIHFVISMSYKINLVYFGFYSALQLLYGVSCWFSHFWSLTAHCMKSYFMENLNFTIVIIYLFYLFFVNCSFKHFLTILPLSFSVPLNVTKDLVFWRHALCPQRCIQDIRSHAVQAWKLGLDLLALKGRAFWSTLPVPFNRNVTFQVLFLFQTGKREEVIKVIFL